MSLLDNRCMNIKSRHYPALRCGSKALLGEYCKKHSKHPTRFLQKPVSIIDISSALRIQKLWRKYNSRNSYKKQGPAIHDYSVSNNAVELYSLDSLESIPKLYFFSFYDINKNIWAFDIRTLSFLCSKSKSVKNPYTQEIFSKDILKKIEFRISYLKQKKVPIMYDNSSFTSEQIWNQKVLEIFNKMEEVGYIVNSDWFHELEKENHINFYIKLYDIWTYRLQLSHKQKNGIVPCYNSVKNKLFKYSPIEIKEKEEKIVKKNNLQIIERLVSSAQDKSEKGLGTMYVLMALTMVSESVAEAYPWILQSVI